MPLTAEDAYELRALKVCVGRLRAQVPSERLMQVCDLLDGLMRTLVDLDDEISELDSRVGYIEHQCGIED